MKTLELTSSALAFSALLIGAAFAQPAGAQAVYGPSGDRREAPLNMQGAGGAGGAGGGATGAGVVAVPVAGCAIGAAPRRDLQVRGATVPPLDPRRSIYATNCTRPFDPQGKGNLCCA